MLGMEDFWVGLAYLLCLLSSLVCVIYGIVNWNKGGDSLDKDDAVWAAEEDKLEQEL
ncbi:MAG: hypothetical protein RRC34_10470 [Lentisphaeria bacterium]|nr:hypothetical protein [Lentisphaeria bacterium]